MINHVVPRRLELAALAAWPALDTINLDGWLLRFAAGYTKRANSINPLVAADANLETKVTTCERIYASHGLPPIFRLTSVAAPPGLDDLLADRGYRPAHPSLVLHRPLSDLTNLDNVSPHRPSDPRTSFRIEPLDPWLVTYWRLADTPPATHAPHAAILHRVTASLLPAALTDDATGAPVACGLGVLDPPFVGLFDIVTAPAHRGLGHATTLVDALLRAAAPTATHAYLQVVRNNTPAIALYRKLGFTDAYHYWYRLPSQNTSI